MTSSTQPLQASFTAEAPETPNKTAKSLFTIFKKGAPLREIALLFKFLATLIQAGLPLTRALQFAGMQAKSPVLKEAMTSVLEDIRSGHHFSEALARFPRLFSELMVQMIVVGENSGDLSGMLLKITGFLENRLEKRSNLMSALAYPILLVVACIGVVIFMLTSAVPKLASIFEGLDAELPPITQFFVNMGAFLNAYGLIILAVLVIGIGGMRMYALTPEGKIRWDDWKLHIPFFGTLLAKTAASQFACTLSILVSGGVPLLRSLDITASAVDNVHIRRRLFTVRDHVSIGESLNSALTRVALFNEVVCAMVAIGEESGELDKMLQHVHGIYEQEVDIATKTFTKLIEPIMILSMTGIVGTIAASILIPLADLSSAIH